MFLASQTRWVSAALISGTILHPPKKILGGLALHPSSIFCSRSIPGYAVENLRNADARRWAGRRVLATRFRNPGSRKQRTAAAGLCTKMFSHDGNDIAIVTIGRLLLRSSGAATVDGIVSWTINRRDGTTQKRKITYVSFVGAVALHSSTLLSRAVCILFLSNRLRRVHGGQAHGGPTLTTR